MKKMNDVSKHTINTGGLNNNKCLVYIVGIFLFLTLCGILIYIVYRLNKPEDCSKIPSCDKKTPCLNIKINECVPYNEGTEICPNNHDICETSTLQPTKSGETTETTGETTETTGYDEMDGTYGEMGGTETTMGS